MNGLTVSGNYFDLRKQHAHALNKAESIVAAAERAQRAMSEDEKNDYDMAMQAVRALGPRLRAIEAQNTVKVTDGGVVVDGKRHYHTEPKRMLSQEYLDAFGLYISSGGQKMDAALYEGSEGAGGYIVPLVVEQQVVPLAPLEYGVRKAAMVIPTAMDMKIPIKGSFGQVGIKAESGSSVNLFTENDPTLQQFTLSAFMIGGTHTLSFELMQDVPVFQQFAIDDLLVALYMFEDNLFVNGTGTGQPQGLLGNVGAGVSGETADAAGNLLSIQATFDVMGTLNAFYHPNASWLMNRATATELRKAQAQANLFYPVFTTVNGQDYLHGHKVEYSGYMPNIAAGATPVLFGDFNAGYLIGDRGGAGINVKILDQPLATQGQIVLLAYRRTDGRVRRSEAIQGITLHS